MADKRIELAIDGMHCEACVARIHEALAACTGVRTAEVDVGRAEVVGDEAEMALSELASAVEGAGDFSIKGFRRL